MAKSDFQLKKSRALNEAEIKEILALTPSDITRSKVIGLFGSTKESPVPRFHTNDYFTLYKKDWNNLPDGAQQIKTTVGRYVFNTFIVKPFLDKHIPYQNDVLNGDGFKKFENKVTALLLDDVITTKQFADYLNRIEWLGFSFTTILCPSTNIEFTKPLASVKKRKKELLEEHKEDLKGENATAMVSKIEKELLDIAKEELKDNSGMILYDSNAGSKFSNHYKNFAVMKGASKSLSKNQFEIIEDNYLDGLKSKDLPVAGDNMVVAAYSRTVDTQMGGYLVKQASAAYQTIVLDKAGTDCGTKLTLRVKIENSNKNLFLYRYIVKGNGLFLLTPENIDQYVGKTVRMRSPMFCGSKKICSKCAGELFYKLDISNVGLLCSGMNSAILNASMKKFHDQTIKTIPVNPEDWIGEINEFSASDLIDMDA